MINFEFSAKSILQQMGLGPSKDEIQNDQPQQSLHNVANHQTETRCDFYPVQMQSVPMNLPRNPLHQRMSQRNQLQNLQDAQLG